MSIRRRLPLMLAAVSYQDMVGSISLPEMRAEPWAVEKVEISRDEARYHNEKLRMDARMFYNQNRGFWKQFVDPGKYTRLVRTTDFGDVIMSDTRFEAITNVDFVNKASGDVLMFGLGPGFNIPFLLRNPGVDKLTVVEICPTLIGMVAPHFASDKLDVLEGDAYSWAPEAGRRFDYVYFDIWSSVSADHYEDIKVLHRRSLRFRKKTGSTRSWERDTFRQLSGR